MDHDDDVGPFLQGQAIAALLIAAVAKVFGMGHHHGVGQLLRNRAGGIPAGVIHHDDHVHHALFHDLVVSLDEGFGRIIGGHDDGDLFSAKHNYNE